MSQKVKIVFLKVIAIQLILTASAHATVYEKNFPDFGEIAAGFTATANAAEMRCLLEEPNGAQMEIFYRRTDEDRSLTARLEDAAGWAWLTPEMQVLKANDRVEKMLVLSHTVPFHVVVDYNVGTILAIVYNPMISNNVQVWTPLACEDFEFVGGESG